MSNSTPTPLSLSEAHKIIDSKCDRADALVKDSLAWMTGSEIPRTCSDYNGRVEAQTVWNKAKNWVKNIEGIPSEDRRAEWLSLAKESVLKDAFFELTQLRVSDHAHRIAVADVARLFMRIESA